MAVALAMAKAMAVAMTMGTVMAQLDCTKGLGKSSFTFENGDGNNSLLILIGCENLRFFGWDNSSSWDNFGHDSTDSLNTERKWGDIDEENVLGLLGGLASENTSLDGSTIGDGLIWVDATVWFLTVEEFLK